MVNDAGDDWEEMLRERMKTPEQRQAETQRADGRRTEEERARLQRAVHGGLSDIRAVLERAGRATGLGSATTGLDVGIDTPRHSLWFREGEDGIDILEDRALVGRIEVSFGRASFRFLKDGREINPARFAQEAFTTWAEKNNIFRS